MRIGVIGCGTIASAVVHGIAQDAHKIVISQRSERYTNALAATYENVSISDNQGVVDASDVIFLGLWAGIAQDVLKAVSFREGQKVITFMGDATLAEADALVAPARAVAIMMPFPGIAQGGTPIMMQGDAALVQEIFGAKNNVYQLQNAKEMAAYLCAQAVLSPVARLVNDAANWLGERVSDKDQGEAFLRDLVSSNLSAMHSAALIEALDGGYNQRLRVHMEASGMSEAVAKGLDNLE